MIVLMLLQKLKDGPQAVCAIDRSMFREGWGDKPIGCANIGMLWGDENDVDEESCKEYVRLMSRPFLPRGGETRHPRLIAHQNSTIIVGDPDCNGRGWLLRGSEGYCSCFYEFSGVKCGEASPRASRRPKAGITYLLYGSERYFRGLEASIRHITASFLNEFPYYDIIVFHSPNFAERSSSEYSDRTDGYATYLELLQEATFVKIIFVEITIDFRDEFREQFTEYVPTGMPCGNYSVDYLHMGRFFQYLMFRHPVVKQVCLCVCVCFCARVYHKHAIHAHMSFQVIKYDYLWRLDADIEMRLGIPCDVFDIMVKSHAVLVIARMHMRTYMLANTRTHTHSLSHTQMHALLGRAFFVGVFYLSISLYVCFCLCMCKCTIREVYLYGTP